tara:strand:+ start:184 stop:366 length:183 start_codon:yes stop_codon:yes gene_type:complete
MDIFLNQIIIFFIGNHFVIIPLLMFFSAALALLVWKRIKQGWEFYSSKRKLIELLREKNL